MLQNEQSVYYSPCMQLEQYEGAEGLWEGVCTASHTCTAILPSLSSTGPQKCVNSYK